MHSVVTATPDPDWGKLRPVLDEAMDELPDADRAAVLMRFFQQRAFAEIGATLRLSEDAARMRVARALDKLQAVLTRRGVASTSAALAIVLTNQAVAVAPAHLAATVTAGAFAGAGAVSGATLAGGVITFMNLSKLAVGLAAIVAAIGIGSAIYEANLAAQAATELTAVRQQQATIAAKAADLGVKLRTAEQNGAAIAARNAELEKELALARKSGGGATSRSPVASENSVSDVWSNPAYARAYIEKYRVSLGLRYGPLYRALALSLDQIARFEAALVEAQQGTVDIWAAASSQGFSMGVDSATHTSVARMTSSPIVAMQETVKALLGEEGYEKFQQFDKARPERDFVASLAGNIYYSETPLTGQQGDALAKIVKANTQVVRTPMASDGKSPLYALTNVTDWEAVSAQAQNLLSPPQLATLRALAEQAKIDSEMNQLQRTPAKPAEKQPGS